MLRNLCTLLVIATLSVLMLGVLRGTRSGLELHYPAVYHWMIDDTTYTAGDPINAPCVYGELQVNRWENCRGFYGKTLQLKEFCIAVDNTIEVTENCTFTVHSTTGAIAASAITVASAAGAVNECLGEQMDTVGMSCCIKELETDPDSVISDGEIFWVTGLYSGTGGSCASARGLEFALFGEWK